MLLHCAVTFAGTEMNTSGVLSCLLTVKEQVAVLPLPSLAVSVTVMAPTPLTVFPAVGAWVTITVVAQLSEVEARVV
jgi:hypothetical protein